MPGIKAVTKPLGRTTTRARNGNGAEPVITELVIRPLEQDTITVPVVGVTPLITHRWSEKAKEEMRGRQSQTAKTKRPPKNPKAEFEGSMYRFPDGGYGITAAAFKSAIVDAARYYDRSVSMEALKRVIRVEGESTIIDGNPTQLIRLEVQAPRQREDAVRVGKGLSKTADLRYRAEFWPWSATLRIKFIKSQISKESLINIVNAGGFGGVGEWRPSAPESKNGTYGCFEVRTQTKAEK